MNKKYDTSKDIETILTEEIAELEVAIDWMRKMEDSEAKLEKLTSHVNSLGSLIDSLPSPLDRTRYAHAIRKVESEYMWFMDRSRYEDDEQFRTMISVLSPARRIIDDWHDRQNNTNPLRAVEFFITDIGRTLAGRR